MSSTTHQHAGATDPLVAEYRRRLAKQEEAVRAVQLADARLDEVRTEVMLSGTLRLSPAQEEALDRAQQAMNDAWRNQAVADEAMRDLVTSPMPMAEQADPLLVRVTVPSGANIRGRHWTVGSVVVADAMTAIALQGAGVAAPAS